LNNIYRAYGKSKQVVTAPIFVKILLKNEKDFHKVCKKMGFQLIDLFINLFSGYSHEISS